MKTPRKKKDKNELKEVESTYWTEVTFTCPKRGRVVQRIEVKRLKPQPTPDVMPGYELEILKNAEEFEAEED